MALAPVPKWLSDMADPAYTNAITDALPFGAVAPASPGNSTVAGGGSTTAGGASSLSGGAASTAGPAPAPPAPPGPPGADSLPGAVGCP